MRRLLLALGLFAASPAVAQEAEVDALCADRPGIASTTCTVAPGRVQVELTIDWTFQEEGDARSDTILAGDTVVRVGLDSMTELQAGWTAYGHVRDRVGPAVDRADGIGDAFVGARRIVFQHGDVEAAVQGRVSLPVGGGAIGAGTWGVELIAPVSIAAGSMEILLAPSIAAAPDADGQGRHLAYGFALGTSFDLVARLSAVLDLAVSRDEDPLGHSTEAVAGIALAYAIGRNVQLDLGAIIGLNRDAADLEIYVGAASRF